MFIPTRFNIINLDEIKDFIVRHSFATVVTTDKGKSIASHLPVMLRQIDDVYYITGHVAYANPLWKALQANAEQALVMFQGPHAYISSSWYKEEEVPTWNYQSVHVYGSATIMSKQELEEDLILLLQKYEQHRENAALWDNLSDQAKKQIRGIVGFKIKFEDVQAAYKLSQNRHDEDYKNIIKKLYEEKDVRSHQMADVMRNRKDFSTSCIRSVSPEDNRTDPTEPKRGHD